MDIPFITYNRKHKNNEYFVEIDNFQAGYLSAKHMIEQGHTSIAWVGGNLTVSTFNNRFLGFLQAMEDYKLPLPNNIFLIPTLLKSDITSLL